MADDFIRREDAMKYLGKGLCVVDWLMLEEKIEHIPDAGVRPVVRGRWKRVDPRSTVVTFRCSECDYYAHMNATNFCPNCGAMMEDTNDTQNAD